VKHTQIVLEILRELKEHNLSSAPEKWIWNTSRVVSVGCIRLSEGIKMDLDNIKTIWEWPQSEFQSEEPMFLRIANCYQLYVEEFRRIKKPISDVLGNAIQCEYSHVSEKVFRDLKVLVTKCSILKHFECMHQIVVDSTSSNFAISAVLSQVID
jgi:hypothetical protein